MLSLLLAKPVVVFQSPAWGYDTFRIPALHRTNRNTLLAFAEARQSQADAAGNHIVISQSVDSGKTWFVLQAIAKPESGSFNNPTIVELPNNTLILHYQHYPANTHEYDVAPGHTGPKTVQSYQITSTNDGRTWSAPMNLTAQIKNPEAHTLASGPGNGIILTRGKHKNRIVIPYNQRIGNRWFVNMAFSDDQGKTWKSGDPVPADPKLQPNEVQVVELAGGHILLNARNQASAKNRLTATSRDGGRTFTPAVLDSNLPDPTCQGSIFRFAWPSLSKPGIIAFSNPASSTSRTQGTLRLSLDEGKTWPQSLLIEPDSFAYSSITTIDDKTIGILYEHVVNNRYQVLFRSISVEPQDSLATFSAKAETSRSR
jgi:sialidase-1